MGLTPIAQISKAQTTGIQRVLSVMWALLAKLNVGTAMSATTERSCNNAVVLKLMEKHRNQQDNEKRRQGRAYAGAECATQLTHLIANEDADVDGENARTTLRNGNEIEKLFFLNPLVLVHYFGLDNGYHGISATQSEHPNLKECAKTVPIYRHVVDELKPHPQPLSKRRGERDALLKV